MGDLPGKDGATVENLSPVASLLEGKRNMSMGT